MTRKADNRGVLGRGTLPKHRRPYEDMKLALKHYQGECKRLREVAAAFAEDRWKALAERDAARLHADDLKAKLTAAEAATQAAQFATLNETDQHVLRARRHNEERAALLATIRMLVIEHGSR